jgi:hypothetical protein
MVLSNPLSGPRADANKGEPKVLVQCNALKVEGEMPRRVEKIKFRPDITLALFLNLSCAVFYFAEFARCPTPEMKDIFHEKLAKY